MNTKRTTVFLLACVFLAGTAGLAFLALRSPAIPHPEATGTAAEEPAAGVASPPEPEAAANPAPRPPDPRRSAQARPSANPSNGPLTPAQVRALARLSQLLEDGDQSANPTLAPIRAWAAYDPAGCARWSLDHLDGAARRRCLEEAVGAWTQQQPPQNALDWLDQQARLLPGIEGFEGAYSLGLAALARQDGSGAVAWLGGHPSQGSLENWESTLGAWAEKSPAEAVQWWASGNLNAGLRDAILPSLLATVHDPAASGALLRGGDPGIVDNALANATRATSPTDATFSMGLAQRIIDPALRSQAVDGVLARWQETDAAAAQAYAAQHGLTLPAVAQTVGGNEIKNPPIEAVTVGDPVPVVAQP